MSAHIASPESFTSDSNAASGELMDRFLQVSHLLRTTLARHFSEFGLTDVRFAVLRTVRSFEPEGCTQSELAARLNQCESSISMLIDRMRNDGLLYRLRSKSDRRKRLLMLSSDGRRLLEQAEALHIRRMDHLLAPLDGDHRRQLQSTLEVLYRTLIPQEPLAAEAQPTRKGAADVEERRSA